MGAVRSRAWGRLLGGIALAFAPVAAGLAPSKALAELPELVWKPSTSSPRKARPPEARDAPLYAMCGTGDAALEAVAGRNLASLVASEGLLSSDDLGFTLRAEGEPHVWARAWSVAAAADEDDV